MFSKDIPTNKVKIKCNSGEVSHDSVSCLGTASCLSGLGERAF